MDAVGLNDKISAMINLRNLHLLDYSDLTATIFAFSFTVNAL